ncbi:MAG TPA: DUF3788 family protein [Bacteroidales bacterium]|nr:DUF3788 family protein [Bacteroidales bacterium]
MEPLVLTDQSVNPTDELIFSIIKENKEHWINLMAAIHRKFPGSAGEWRYYNDGKSWLFKMTLKKKTLFWLGVQQDTFRVTYYFGDKAETAIENSTLPASVISDFMNGRRFGKLRAITFKMYSSADVENALVTAEIKSKFL